MKTKLFTTALATAFIITSVHGQTTTPDSVKTRIGDLKFVGALALVGTTLSNGTTALAQVPDGSKPPAAGDLKAIKTRVASCNCGQLRVTCTGPDPDRSSCATVICARSRREVRFLSKRDSRTSR